MKRKIILISLFIIALISLVLYRTLATDITMKETAGEADLTYNIDINDTDGRTITVEAGKTKVFDIFVTNKNGGSIKYGIAYKPTITTDIKVLKLNTSKDDVTGIINNDTTLQISLVIDNKGTSNLTYNIIPITGYEKGGDLSVPSGYTTISEVYKFSKPRTSDEMLKYLGLTAKTGTPNFANTATTDEGIYSAPDDYGTSYYFRGASTNNYVKFANKWWRIVRINGDGSIRMIYDGTTSHNNGESNIDRQIGKSAFNGGIDYNAYVGYMYGKPNSSTYDSEHANTNNSKIKGVVDNWYKTNIIDTGYSDKIADVIYCNDRQIASDSTSYGYTALGYGVNKTVYAPTSRVYTTSWGLESVQIPKLTCSQQNDAFTVKDEVKGNGALTYPVSLITLDEVLVAGGKAGTINSSYYLCTGNYYWTMSPYHFNYSNASEFVIETNGSGSAHGITNQNGIRPVISLRNDIEITGTGTQTDPFIPQN